MKEQDFIAMPSPRFRRLLFVSAELRTAAAAAASAAGVATLAFVMAVMPVVPSPGVLAATADGLHAGTAFA